MRRNGSNGVPKARVLVAGPITAVCGAAAFVAVTTFSTSPLHRSLAADAATTAQSAAAATTTVPSATTTVPSATSSPAVSTTLPPGNPAVCAGHSGIFFPPTNIDPKMVVTATASEASPPTMGIPVSGSPPPTVAPYEWFQSEQAQLSTLPPGFGLYNPSSLVTQDPLSVFQVVETIQSFPSPADAETFVSLFSPASVKAEVPNGSSLAPVSSNEQTLSLGNESLVLVTTAPVANMPHDLQFVVRVGATVLTVEFVGGSGITASQELPTVSAAVALVTSVCPTP